MAVGTRRGAELQVSALALPVMWTACKQRGMRLERIGEWMAAAPARLAGLAGRKGAIAAGADADFVVFDPDGRVDRDAE